MREPKPPYSEGGAGIELTTGLVQETSSTHPHGEEDHERGS